ncbi:uncharacterized protein LOC144008046 isoform X4 [Festucalex cinctus]
MNCEANISLASQGHDKHLRLVEAPAFVRGTKRKWTNVPIGPAVSALVSRLLKCFFFASPWMLKVVGGAITSNRSSCTKRAAFVCLC